MSRGHAHSVKRPIVRAIVATGLLAVVAAFLIACDAFGRSTATAGPFRLELSLPKTVWSVGEAIEGEAILSLASGPGRDLGGSGSGLLLFGFEEIGGKRLIQPAMSSDCAGYRLEPDTPMRSPLQKSGGWSADDPDAAFYQAFFADPLIRLPPGEWRVSAIATFINGFGCDGNAVSMETWIDIRVVP